MVKQEIKQKHDEGRLQTRPPFWGEVGALSAAGAAAQILGPDGISLILHRQSFRVFGLDGKNNLTDPFKYSITSPT